MSIIAPERGSSVSTELIKSAGEVATIRDGDTLLLFTMCREPSGTNAALGSKVAEVKKTVKVALLNLVIFASILNGKSDDINEEQHALVRYRSL